MTNLLSTYLAASSAHTRKASGAVFWIAGWAVLLVLIAVGAVIVSRRRSSRGRR